MALYPYSVKFVENPLEQLERRKIVDCYADSENDVDEMIEHTGFGLGSTALDLSSGRVAVKTKEGKKWI